MKCRIFHFLHPFFCLLVAFGLCLPKAYAISTGTGAEEFPLGSDAGDDLNVGSGKLVVEGDTGNVGIGDASPDSALDVETGDVRVGTGTFNNASGASDAYVTGNLEVDGAIFATIPLTGISDINSATQGAGRILISDGSKFNSTSVSGSCSITSGGVLNCTDTGATDLAGLSDVNGSTQGAGRMLISDGSQFNSAAVSGDVTITSGGVTDLGAGVVGANEIASSGVTAATYNAATLTVDADGRVTAAASSSLTGLSDVNSATQGVGRLLVSDGNKFNSVSLLTVDNSTGNVGIGNTSPAAKLDVNGSISSSGVGDSYFTGNLGIGDTTPGEALDVAGTIQTTGFKLTTGATNGYVLTSSATGVGTWQASSGGASSLTGLSDVNSSTQGAGRILVSDGSDFQSTTVSGDITITSGGVTDLGAGVVGANEIASSGVTAATYEAATIAVDADGRVTAAASSSLTGLTDVNSATQGAGRILISDGSQFNSTTVSGSCTITSGGVINCNNDTLSLSGLSDVNGATQGAGRILISDGAQFNSTTVSGDVSITNAGAVDIAADTIGTAELVGINSLTATSGRVLIADGNSFNSVDVSGDITMTSAGVTDLSDTGVTANSYNNATIVIDAEGRITSATSGTGASSLTGLSDVNSATQGAGRILVSDGSKFHSTSVSGDLTITSGGVTDITNSGVTANTYNAATLTVAADGRITAAASSSLTGLSDVNSATQGAGRILVSDGNKFNSVTVSAYLPLPIQSAKLPSTNPAAIDAGENNWRLLYDASTAEDVLWQFVMPQDYGSSLSLRVLYSMNSANAGGVSIDVAVMATTPGDGADINTDSYDTVNNCDDATVPGTVGYLDSISCTLTNADSVAAGDLVKIDLKRQVADASDTATGDMEVVGVMLEYNKQ